MATRSGVSLGGGVALLMLSAAMSLHSSGSTDDFLMDITVQDIGALIERWAPGFGTPLFVPRKYRLPMHSRIGGDFPLATWPPMPYAWERLSSK